MKEYKDFLNTNANSLHFSVYTCIIIIFTVIIDIIVLIGVTAIFFAAGEQDTGAIITSFISATKLGFGKSIVLIFAIPFVMMFSYTKTYKDKLVDKAIPLGGIALIAAVYIEGVFQLLCAIL